MRNNPSTERKAKKTRKSRTGLPYVDLIDAIGYANKAYSKFATNLKTFAYMAEAMGMKKAYARRAFGEISEYGLIEKAGLYWRVSDLGKRAVEGDKGAIEHMLVKNEIMGDLFKTFKDSSPERDVLEAHIKRKKPALSANYIADRFLKIMNYLNNIPQAVILKKSDWLPTVKPEWHKIIQLKYVLNPPKEGEIADLAKEVADGLKKDESESTHIKVLADQLKKNLSNKHAITLLVNSIFEILSKEHPEFFLPKTERTEQTPEEK